MGSVLAARVPQPAVPPPPVARAPRCPSRSGRPTPPGLCRRLGSCPAGPHPLFCVSPVCHLPEQPCALPAVLAPRQRSEEGRSQPVKSKVASGGRGGPRAAPLPLPPLCRGPWAPPGHPGRLAAWRTQMLAPGGLSAGAACTHECHTSGPRAWLHSKELF